MDTTGREALLDELYWGNPVAEQDEELAKYFVETGVFGSLRKRRVDIVLGTKGSGKSALLKILLDAHDQYPDLEGIILIPAVNLKGDPVFRRFKREKQGFSEEEYIDLWKIYIINLLWPQIKKLAHRDRRVMPLGKKLASAELLIDEDTPKGLVDTIVHRFQKLPKLKRITTTATLAPDGTPIVLPGFEFDTTDTTKQKKRMHEITLDYDDVFAEIDEIVRGEKVEIWILLDRLDDSFIEDRKTEAKALRAILHTYKDLMSYSGFRLKIFLRDDIYQRVTTERGFPALTHVANMASPPIRWTGEKMLDLVVRRIMHNEPVVQYYQISDNLSNEEIFYTIFPEKVEPGEKRPRTLSWMISRIQDGTAVFTPRDMIWLLKYATEAQKEIWRLEPPADPTGPLIEGPALKQGLADLSRNKCETYLYAEYNHLRPDLDKFKGGKAEHNASSLKRLLGQGYEVILKQLVAVGFLSHLRESDTYKIPFIYRDAFEIKRGKAFRVRKGSAKR